MHDLVLLIGTRLLLNNYCLLNSRGEMLVMRCGRTIGAEGVRSTGDCSAIRPAIPMLMIAETPTK